MVRLEDGKDQFFPGKWNTSLTSQMNAYVFGEFPKDYPTTQKGQQLYFVHSAREIENIPLKNFIGEITGVMENQKATYMMVTLRQDGVYTLCILEREGKEGKLCDLQFKPGTDNVLALWDPTHVNKAVMRDVHNGIYTYNPWDEELAYRIVDPEQEKDEYERLLKLFETEATNTNVLEGRKLKKILNIAVVTTDEKTNYYRVPLFSKIAWLSDAQHILVKTRDKIEVYELPTKIYAPILTFPGLWQKEIILRNQNFDQKL